MALCEHFIHCQGEMDSRNIVRQSGLVNLAMREKRNGHRGVVVWFTGLSGAGKSALAHAVEGRLFESGYSAAVLDGDNVRHGLCSDLGFGDMDRSENVRRVGEVAGLFANLGMIVLCAFISPFRKDRDRVRNMGARFIEVYCRCPLSVCEARDVKGLYARARAGDVAEFTGISSPYEPPENAELVINTDELSLDEAAAVVISYIKSQEIIPAE